MSDGGEVMALIKVLNYNFYILFRLAILRLLDSKGGKNERSNPLKLILFCSLILSLSSFGLKP